MAREGEREETLMCKRYMDWLPLTRPQLGTWPLTQACALTGNRTGDLWVCRPALNPLSHTSQGKIISFYLLIKGGNKMFLSELITEFLFRHRPSLLETSQLDFLVIGMVC